MPNWIEQGAKCRVFIATDSYAWENGIRTDYPFVAGGTFSNPIDWNRYTYNNPDDWSSVNVTTQSGRFSTSNAISPTVHVNRLWGIERRWPVAQGRTYIVSVQCRTMDDRDAGMRYIEIMAQRPSGYSQQQLWYRVTQPEWETIALRCTFPSDATEMGIRLYGGYTNVNASVGQGTNWGLQWQNVSILDMPVGVPVYNWREITCDVKNVGIRYGRERYTERYDVGSLTLVVMNEDGEYAYMPFHPFNLSPGSHIKVTGVRPTMPSVQSSLYYGIIDSINDGFTMDGRAIATITAVDPTSLLANKEIPTTATAGADREPLAHVRAQSIFNIAAWPFTESVQGAFYQQEITSSGRSIRDELAICADSEGGRFFSGPDGKIIYRGRNWTNERETVVQMQVEATGFFEDRPLPIVDQVPTDPNAPRICAREFVTSWSRDRIINLVSLANEGGSAYQFENDESQRKYGPFTYQRHDFVNSNAYPEYLAQRATDYMDGYADAIMRVDSVEFVVQGNVTWLTLFTKTWIGTLIRIWYVHPTNFWGFIVATRIQSIEHEISLTEWSVRFAVDQPIAFLRFDFSACGWDTGKWDINLWDQTDCTLPYFLNPAIGYVVSSMPTPAAMPTTFTVIADLIVPAGFSGATATTIAYANSVFEMAFRSNAFYMRIWSSGAWLGTAVASAAQVTAAGIVAGARVRIAGSVDQQYFGSNIQYRANVSVNGGHTWTAFGTPVSFAAGMNTATGPIQVGVAGGAWTGARIYSCELRTGLAPAAGTVVWRFEANEYDGSGTSFIDARGRTWNTNNENAFQKE